MPRGYRSAVWLFLLLSGCAPQKPQDRVLSLSLHWLPGCAGDLGQGATLELSALGDFDASPLTAEVFDASESGRQLSFPPLTQAVEARLGTSAGHWLGVAERKSGTVQLPLWPASTACPLYTPAGADRYPDAAQGEALGWSPDQHTLLVAGELSTGTHPAHSTQAISLDLTTGKASQVPGGMLQGRAYATITPFGKNLLVAGGIDTQDTPGEPPLDSALVYDIAAGRFDNAHPIALSRRRAHHAALVLPSGETLLVGGVDSAGEALVPLEAVSPADHSARAELLATPAVGRIDPVAIRLDDGNILIGGGTDSNGKPIGRLEWLTPSASEAYYAPRYLPPRFDRAFVAMPGGGALAVGGCEDRAPAPGEDCSECAHGCPPSGGFDAWWITPMPQGVPQQLPPLPVDAPHPVLIPAENGAPFLWSARAKAWLRFDPWQARFVEVAGPAPGPDAGLPAPIAIDPGAFVWLARSGQRTVLSGFRHGTRERFAFDLLPLLDGVPPEGSFPESPAWHLSPDRSPLGSNAQVRFDPARGLVLDGDYATAVLTDTSYASLRLEMKLVEGAPPRVLLGGHELGDTDCPWPASSSDSLTLLRRAGSVELERGGAKRVCALGGDRVTVAFGAGGKGRHSVIREVTVRRDVP